MANRQSRSHRPEKKSEMIEVRVSHSQKKALSALCESQGSSLSETVRNLIDGELAGPVRRASENRLRIETMSTLLKSRPRTILASLLASAGAVTLMLTASSAAGAREPAFEAIDVDRSETIELHEFINAATADGLMLQAMENGGTFDLSESARLEFIRYDRNADGRISSDEFSDRYIPLVEASFHALDIDLSGEVSVHELAYNFARGGVNGGNDTLPAGLLQLAEHYILELDADGNSALSLEEFMAES